mmetsp:Transcript_14024/g.29661  ORF Transcript_14024/g.29661 Transcript_14024/m.29661 type:complete len:221 (-) Transcript_14024:420-1082(-)
MSNGRSSAARHASSAATCSSAWSRAACGSEAGRRNLRSFVAWRIHSSRLRVAGCHDGEANSKASSASLPMRSNVPSSALWMRVRRSPRERTVSRRRRDDDAPSDQAHSLSRGGAAAAGAVRAGEGGLPPTPSQWRSVCHCTHWWRDSSASSSPPPAVGPCGSAGRRGSGSSHAAAACCADDPASEDAAAPPRRGGSSNFQRRYASQCGCTCGLLMYASQR